MGCCLNHQVEPFPLTSSKIIDLKEITFLASVLNEVKLTVPKNEIDEPIIVINKITLNPLGYSLVSGRLNSFKSLIEDMGASVTIMEGMMERQDLNGLDLIIEKNYTDLLRYYLPIYKLAFPHKFTSIEDSETSCSIPYYRTLHKTPLHLATERGYIEILKILYSSFQNTFTPEKYNIHHVDEYSGENSALIACKKCNLSIVMFLNEQCNADFNLKSKRSESSLHLAAFGSNTNKIESFEVIKYLVEVVKIDLTFQYEEILLILNDFRILEYVEQKLKAQKIICTKEEVENKYSISSYKASKAVCVFENDSEFTMGAISSIDATMSVINASSFLDSDYN
ncbi:hypothetical protein SteCoe_212 [Stentor coeruleus]|uniref:Uncharacterized protein n=1 Tax=Stentor coeruleus TaxID=5963 RepID=A0A1R2D4R9_9CILI|nr:hypothetical protein SteCoe_212 [Stentor coeruleus]